MGCTRGLGAAGSEIKSSPRPRYPKRLDRNSYAAEDQTKSGMTHIIIAAIVGAGLVTGLLFAFSNFVMSALADVSHENGMLVMQRINERIINPIFVLLFLGTPVLCVIIAIRSGTNLDAPGSLLRLLGSICYVIGPFGITMLFNVPLNNQLAKTKPSDANTIWTDYQIRWQRWNHVRTSVGILSITLLGAGLGELDIGI